MKVHFDSRQHVMKGIDVRLSPVEGLLLQSALSQFAEDPDNNKVDRLTAAKMCNDYNAAREKLVQIERG